MKNSCIIFFLPNITQNYSHQHSFLKPNPLVQLMEHDVGFKHISFGFFWFFFFACLGLGCGGVFLFVLFYFLNKAMHKITCNFLSCP